MICKYIFIIYTNYYNPTYDPYTCGGPNLLKRIINISFRKTKIATLISIDFDDFTSPFTPYFFVSIKKVHPIFERVFYRLSKHLEFHQNTRLRVLFSTYFSLFGYVDETLSRV